MDRVYPDGAAGERAALTGFLDWQRATVRRKAEGLATDLATRALMTTSPRMTVSGVVSHLQHTEHGWFTDSFPSLAPLPERDRADDGGWRTDGRTIDDLVNDYETECKHSRLIVEHVSMDTMQEFTPPQFSPVSVRWILTHMIEETARHVGHLDILREQLDGVRGY